MRILSFSMIFLLCISSIQAADIDDLDIGEGVYVEGVFSDELVYITRIDKFRNRVKVRRVGDNTTEWFNPSRLITRGESRANNYGRAMDVFNLAACALNSDYCPDSSNGSGSTICESNDQSGCGFTHRNSFEDPAPPSRTSTASSSLMIVDNQCDKKIKVALRYLDLNQEWVTEGYWELEGTQAITLGRSGGEAIRVTSDDVYVWGEIIGTQYAVVGTDYSANFRSETLNMKQEVINVDSDGKRTWLLACDGI